MNDEAIKHIWSAHLIKGTQAVSVLPISEFITVALQDPELLLWAVVLALRLLEGPQLSGQVPHPAVCLIKLFPGLVGSC